MKEQVLPREALKRNKKRNDGRWKGAALALPILVCGQKIWDEFGAYLGWVWVGLDNVQTISN